MSAYLNNNIFPFCRRCLPLLLACLILPLFSSCESRKTIVNALTEKEANEIWVFLSGKGVEVTKVQSAEGGGAGARKEVLWDIQVPSNQAAEAIALLNQSGLPRRRGQSLLGIFQNGGLVPSEMTEKIKYQSGLAEQIANTIRKIDGVLDAEVQISFPEEDPLNLAKKKQTITASVYVKHSGVLDDPNTHLVTKIKRLVAASITGLDYDNVTVIGDRARFAESPLGAQGRIRNEDKPYVTVWSLILAKESVGLFRLIFFSFIIIILVLIVLFVWMWWKISPVIHDHGGFKSLLSLHPIIPGKSKASKKKEGEEEEGEESEGDEEEEEEEIGEPGEIDVSSDEEEKGPPNEVT